MKKEEMRKIVNEELTHISKEGVDQNILRMFYNTIRSHDLSKFEDTPKEESLKKAIKSVKKQNPNFVPSYDKDFFKINEF